MASFEVTGFIRQIKYSSDCCFVTVDEYHSGFRKADGTEIPPVIHTWVCLFKASFKSYISKYFSNGRLVQIKGEVKPFALEEGKMIDGYSVVGQVINMASYPQKSFRTERKMIRETMAHTEESPDVASYMESDF